MKSSLLNIRNNRGVVEAETKKEIKKKTRKMLDLMTSKSKKLNHLLMHMLVTVTIHCL
jgi:chorismate mutase